MNHTIQEEGSHLFVKTSGTATIAGFENLAQELASVLVKRRAVPRVLVDHSDLDPQALEQADALRIARTFLPLTDHLRNGRIAIVAGTESDIAFTRESIAHLPPHHTEVDVFGNVEQALAWLRGPIR